MTGRPQRLVFGTVAEAYDEHRPGYPDAVLDLFAERARAGERGAPSVLDIGAGTGRVATALADRGLGGVAVEPDPAMAGIARRRLPPVTWEVVVAEFESVSIPGARTFDLATCGQAWHWIDADRGLARAHALLVPGGWLALFWNRPEWPDRDVRAALDDVYARLAPDMQSSMASPEHGHKGVVPTVDPPPAGFAEAAVVEFHHTIRYSSQQWVDLLGTHSNHVQLDAAHRAELHAAVAGVIDAHGGGMEVRYRTECWTARRI